MVDSFLAPDVILTLVTFYCLIWYPSLNSQTVLKCTSTLLHWKFGRDGSLSKNENTSGSELQSYKFNTSIQILILEENIGTVLWIVSGKRHESRQTKMHFDLASIRISFLDCVMMQCFKLQVQTKFEVGIRLLYPSFSLNYSSNLLFGKFLAQLDCITSHPRIISWCTSLSEGWQRSIIHMLVSFHF